MSFRWKIAQAAEIRWWQNYLKNKPITEYSYWKVQYWETLLAETGIEVKNTDQSRPLGEGVRILDAGCGPAGIFMIFKTQNVDALDPLLNDYEAKLPHFKKSLYQNVHFYNQSLESFDRKNEYDAVFCLNAINHVADLDKSFDILVDSVKPGGHLVVSIDAHNFSLLKKVFQAIPGDILHPHQFNLAEYTDMLTSRGCVLEKTILKKKEFIFNYYILVLKKI
jgi:2-polyprenyl-3-methyl-5-hydroxy-6-metoxy-1,4-benzoquinol methylase